MLNLLTHHLASLEAVRKHAIRLIATMVEDSMQTHQTKFFMGSCGQTSAYIDRRFADLITQLSYLQFWPVTGLNSQAVETIIGRLRSTKLEEPNTIEHCQARKCWCNRRPSFADTRGRLQLEADNVQKLISQVCYHCTREFKGAWNPEIKCEHQLSDA